MIKRIFVFSLLLLSFYVHAQKDSNRFREPFISINAGGGIPTNNFYIDEPGGIEGFGSYATSGYTINLLGGTPIVHSRWGIIGSISYNAEPFDVNQRFLDLCFSDYTNQLVSSNYSDFKEALLMGGVFFSVRKKSAFNLRLMAGGNFCTLAGYSLMGTTTTITLRKNITTDVTSSLQSASASAIAYDFGVDYRFLQRKHIIGLLSCDFMYSQAYFNTTSTNDSRPINYHFRVNYNLLSITAGVGYKL